MSSSPCNIVCGVPQGSILGPMLFVCYINDIEKHLHYSTPFLFADDTVLLVDGISVEDIGNKRNTDLSILTRYFAANKLQLNAKKTKSILFRSTQKFKSNNELLLNVGIDEIEQVDSFKYLGVFVDAHLTFKSHLDHITKKSKQRTSVLWRMRGFISKNLALQLFKSLIKPLYTYCDFVYDGCSMMVAKQFEVLQNAGLKAVSGAPGRFSASALRNELGITTLTQSHKESTCIELYKLLEGKGPQSLVNEFRYREINRALRGNLEPTLEVKKNPY